MKIRNNHEKIHIRSRKLDGLDSIDFERPLVLYGAGIRGRRILAIILEIGQANVFVMDRSQERQKEGILGVDVLSPDNIPETILETALFCITLADPDIINDVRKELVERKCIFETVQEISYDSLCLKIYDFVDIKNNPNHVGKWILGFEST